jgi:preprotein translocase subunit SecF
VSRPGLHRRLIAARGQRADDGIAFVDDLAMIQLFHNPSYDFIGRRKWTYCFSGLLVAICLGSLAIQGIRYDIDFSGGALVQIRFDQPTRIDDVRAALGKIGLAGSVIQQLGGASEYVVRLPLAGATTQDVAARVQRVLAAEASLGKSEIRRVEFVGPQVGKDLQWQALTAVLLSLGGILLYIAVRFDLKGAVAAVLAVFHDVIVCLGAISLAHREFSLPVLAALLTIIGYQVNDTIVAYDRLRENRARVARRGASFAEQMNDAINQTLSRTVLTALTVVLASAVLFLFGGETLEDLAFVLLIGVVTGTYSTIYVAGALVVDWTLYAESRVRSIVGRVPGAGGARRSREKTGR